MVQYILGNTTELHTLVAHQTKTYEENQSLCRSLRNSILDSDLQENRFLSQPLRRLFCNVIIQPHFDYTYSAWYPNLNKSLKKKLHNQYVHFCLKLNNKDHTGLTEFEKINWLPINDCFKQCISSITFKFFNNRNLAYTSEVFKQAGHPNTNTRASFVKLNQPLRNTKY